MSNNKDPGISSDIKDNILDTEITETINPDGSVSPEIEQQEGEEQQSQSEK